MTYLPEFEANSLFYIGVFLGVLLAFEGLRQALTRSESISEARNRRMRMIASGASTKDVLNLLNPTQGRWLLSGVPILGSLPTSLRQAGMTIRPQLFLLACFSASATISAAASTLIMPALAIGVSVLICFILPVFLVRFAQARRMAQMVSQLPDALDLMARGLKVGHPLNSTIAAVASDMNDPVATEFGIIVDQISYGDDLVDAFMDFADRTDLEDVRYLSVSVAIQAGTGGNLAEVLNTLAKVIRDRISMRKRILALSSEGRLTSIFLSCIPLVILGATSLTAPHYYAEVSDDPLFRPFAAVVAVLVVVNFLVMRRLVRFKI
ncbi:MAG: type II secretion system F family protein [Albidovulum sp.]